MSTRAEKTFLQRYVVASGSNIRKGSADSSGMIHAQHTRTETVALYEENHVSMNHSEHHNFGPVIHR